MTNSARRLNNDQLLNILALSKDATAVYTGEELIIEIANDAMIGFWGKDRSVIGHSFIDAVPELAGQPFFDLLQEVWRTGVTYEATDTAAQHRVGGRLQWSYYDFIYRAIKNDKGEVYCILHTATDVTARHLRITEGLDREQDLHEELTATNEELNSANAEANRANEALSLSKSELLRLTAELEQRVSLKGSELTTAYQEAERQRARMKRFFMQAPAGICILDGPQLVFELVNPLYQQLFSGRELLGKSLLEAVPEIKDAPIWEIIQNVYRTGKTFEGNELLIPLARIKDGPVENRYFNFIYQARHDEMGTVDGILVFVIEVTEHVKVRKEMTGSYEELARANEELTAIQRQLEVTNQELSASSSRLRMAIESTNLGTWDYSPQTGQLYWSKECRDVYGYPDQQPVSFTAFSEHLHPDDREWVEAAIENAIDPVVGGRYDLSFRIVRFDNAETRWVKVNGAAYFEQGKAARFIGTVLDITDIKLAQEESSKLAAIVASSDDAIVSKTLAGVITSWNRSAERMFGFTAAEMTGQSIYKLIPEDRWHEESEILTRLRSGERVEHFETKRLTKDGRQLDVSMSVSPVRDSEGNMIGLSKIARDITERKLDETRKSDFIGMVSHELKTPLTSLNAILQVAESKLKTSDDGFLSGAMQKANVQVKRMTAMINGFLNVSRLESAKILIEKRNFQLDELVAEVIDETNLTAGSHSISFDPCPPVAILADRDKISSVITNLIGNAIKYSPNGTVISVKCEIFDGKAMVSVKDNGMGIAKEDLLKIFDRYYRVQSKDSKHISGFGIGLYLSAEIIHRHEGKLWAESEIGKGSTFYFTLPLN